MLLGWAFSTTVQKTVGHHPDGDINGRLPPGKADERSKASGRGPGI